MTYDGLVSELAKEGVDVIEHKFCNRALKGLYVDNVLPLTTRQLPLKKKKPAFSLKNTGTTVRPMEIF